MSDLESGRFVIDLPTALGYAKNWRDPALAYKYTELHGFLMAKENLEDLLSQNPDGVRAYLGIDSETGQAKLMLVGTKWHGPTESHNDMLPGTANAGEIFDFTRPCPKACGFESPFNNLTPRPVSEE